MAERNPPSWLQGGSHPAEHDRLVLASLVPSEGIVGFGDLAVSQNATPDLSVNVAAGAAFIQNDLAAYGGMYHIQNDATVNIAVTAADPTNPRKDLVVARVSDTQYAGGADEWALAILTGTPAATPAEPALPLDASYLVLALIDVAAGATTVTDANLTDRRPRAAVPANNAIPAGAMMPFAGTGAPAGWLLCDGAAVSRTLYAALFAAIGTAYGAGDGASTFNLPDTRSRSLVGAGQGTGLTNRTLGAKGGAETHILATAEMPAHGHTQNAHNHTQNGHDHTQDSHNHPQNSHGHGVSDPTHEHLGETGLSYLVGELPTSTQFINTGLNEEHTNADVSFTATTAHAGTGVSVNGNTATNQAATANNQPATATNQSATATNQNTGGGGAHNNMSPWLAVNHIIKAF